MGVKLGQKWAVKDGNLLASNQVGSRFFNKEFDFSRASDGTYVDRDGLLKTAELYNLFPNSENFSSGGWTITNGTLVSNEEISPQGVQNATKINFASGGELVRTTSFTIGQQYTFSFYAKVESGTFDFNYGNIDYTLISGTATTEWQRFEVTQTAPVATRFPKIDATDIGDLLIFGAQLVLGTQRDYQYTNGLQGLPRISFEDGVGHLLLEPQTTQLVPYSEAFTSGFWDNASVGTAPTLEGGYLAPDGTNTAFKISNPTQDSFWYYPSVVLGTSSRSIYARSVSGTGTAQLMSHNLNTNNTFTLTEQWQRFEVSSVTSGAGTNNFYAVDFRGSGTLNEIIVWGANATNDQTYPTSYIKTEGTAVTRLADVCNNSGSAQDFNSEEGVLYAEIAALVDDGTNRRFTLNDGTTTNQVVIGYHSVLNEFRCFVVTASGLSCDLRPSVTSILDYHKIAFKYKENDFSIWVDGVEAATDSSGVVPIGLNQIDFTEGNGANPFYGKVRNLQVFTEALSDEELESLTQG